MNSGNRFSRRRLLAAMAAGIVAPAAFLPATAKAATYLTPAQAREVLFPRAASFVDRSAAISPQQAKAIRASAGVPVRVPRLNVWEARDAGGRRLGLLLIDQVLGKHEFITYALALDATGAVKGLEIMDYRETYGDQVRMPAWRAQFNGKRSGQPLRIDRDIRNISGATLSCVHVTDGVRRLLTTAAVLGI